MLQNSQLKSLLSVYPRGQVVAWVREAISELRQQILDGQSLSPAQFPELLLERITNLQHAEQSRRLQRVINATGILLHTNLGRAPLANAAVQRVLQTASSTNLELDLTTGRRSQRGAYAVELLRRLTGAEDTVVVNNCAAATILVLQAVAHGRVVIISRSQLVEIGGGFRLPDVFKTAGVELREVGTTNRTYVRDYQQAISEDTAAIIRVHHSNFRLTGFVTEPSIEELVQMRRPPEIPVIDDLGSGYMGGDSETVGCPLGKTGEPIVQNSIAAGANLCLFSGDKLFGGPQCGIIVGQSKWIERLRSSPLMRALRVDKMSLAALEATAEIHLAGRARNELPVYRMLYQDAADVRAKCQELLSLLQLPSTVAAQIEPCDSQIGGGSVPGYNLASFAVTLQASSSEQLAAAMRTAEPVPILCRQAANKVYLDLRTVSPEDIQGLADSLNRILVSSGQQSLGAPTEAKQGSSSHQGHVPNSLPSGSEPA